MFIDDGTKTKVKFVDRQGTELLAEVDAAVLPSTMGGTRSTEDRLVTGSDGVHMPPYGSTRASMCPSASLADGKGWLRVPVARRFCASIMAGDGRCNCSRAGNGKRAHTVANQVNIAAQAQL